MGGRGAAGLVGVLALTLVGVLVLHDAGQGWRSLVLVAGHVPVLVLAVVAFRRRRARLVSEERALADEHNLSRDDLQRLRLVAETTDWVPARLQPLARARAEKAAAEPPLPLRRLAFWTLCLALWDGAQYAASGDGQWVPLVLPGLVVVAWLFQTRGRPARARAALADPHLTGVDPAG